MQQEEKDRLEERKKEQERQRIREQVEERVKEVEEEVRKRKEEIRQRKSEGLSEEILRRSRLENEKAKYRQRLEVLGKLAKMDKNKVDPKTIKFDLKEVMKNQTDITAVLHFDKNITSRSNDRSALKKENLDELNSRHLNKSSLGPIYSDLSPSIRRKKDSEMPNFKSRLKANEIIKSYINESSNLKRGANSKSDLVDKKLLNSRFSK